MIRQLITFSLVQMVASGMHKAKTAHTMGINLLGNLELPTKPAAHVVEAWLPSQQRALPKIPAAATIRATGLIAKVTIAVFTRKAATVWILETCMLTIMVLQPSKRAACVEEA